MHANLPKANIFLRYLRINFVFLLVARDSSSKLGSPLAPASVLRDILPHEVIRRPLVIIRQIRNPTAQPLRLLGEVLQHINISQVVGMTVIMGFCKFQSFLFLQRPLIHQKLLKAHNQDAILVIVPYHIVFGHNNLSEPVTHMHQRALLLLPFLCSWYREC